MVVFCFCIYFSTIFGRQEEGAGCCAKDAWGSGDWAPEVNLVVFTTTILRILYFGKFILPCNVIFVQCVDWTGGQIKDDDSAEDVKNVDLTQVPSLFAHLHTFFRMCLTVFGALESADTLCLPTHPYPCRCITFQAPSA